MLKNSLKYAWLNDIKSNVIKHMESKAEQVLNPFKYTLSNQARKRLKWMYVLFYECENNVSKAANKVGVSREWLSKLKTVFEKNNKCALSLEPKSKAPHDTSNRQRISKYVEDKILLVRGKYPCWGEEKIVRILYRDYKIKTCKNTVNRYLHKHHKIDPLISARNKKAWQNKKEKEEQKQVELKVKYRPPRQIKDWKPNIEIINKRKKDISFLQKNNIKTVIKIMLSKNSNIERQIKIATSLKRIYAKLFISIDRFCPLNNKDYKYVLSTTSLLKIIRKIRLIFGSSFITNDPIARTMFCLDNNDERHKNKKITHSSDCIYGCIIPNGGFAIYPDGTIKLCSRIGGFDTGFDINNFNLVEYLRKFKYIQYLKKNNCGDCQLFNLCAGGCIGTSYAKNNLIDKDTHCLKSITI